MLGAFRENWLPFLGGLVLVVGLSALRLSALVNGIGTALYAFAAGALAISEMVLPGIFGSSLLMSCGLCLSVIAAMKDLLHFFQFGSSGCWRRWDWARSRALPLLRIASAAGCAKRRAPSPMPCWA